MTALRRLILSLRKRRFLDTLFVGFALVFIWRGAWGFLDLYLPHTAEWYLVCVAIGIFLIWIDDFKIDEIKRG